VLVLWIHRCRWESAVVYPCLWTRVLPRFAIVKETCLVRSRCGSCACACKIYSGFGNITVRLLQMPIFEALRSSCLELSPHPTSPSLEATIQLLLPPCLEWLVIPAISRQQVTPRHGLVRGKRAGRQAPWGSGKEHRNVNGGFRQC